MRVRFLDTSSDWQSLGQHWRLERTMNYWGIAKADCLHFKKNLIVYFSVGGVFNTNQQKNAYFSVFYAYFRGFFLWDRSSRSEMSQILYKDRYLGYMDIKTNYPGLALRVVPTSWEL